MNVIEAIKTRKSIRAFRPEPVSESILKEIIETAILSPSSENSQSWEFTVVDSECARLLGKKFKRNIIEHVPINPDIKVPKEWHGIYGIRSKNLGKALFTHIGIPRGDREKRREYYFRMYDFFGAPNAIYLYIDEIVFGFDWTIFDAGLITQNMVLLATAMGLGTCIEGAVVFYPDIVREVLAIPNSKKLVAAVAIGYPDWDENINRFKSERDGLDKFYKFISTK